MSALLPLKNRTEAGRLLAAELEPLLRGRENLIVLALPRGGVPVAAEIARTLRAPLDLLLVRKIGLPWQPELAYAALVEGSPPELVINEEVARWSPLPQDTLDAAVARETQEIERRRALYLRGRPHPALAGRTVVLVDDGLATGTTARAALQGLHRRGAGAIWLAVPVAARETLQMLQPLVERIVCLAVPEPLNAIGLHYRDFHQLEDAEVTALMDRAAAG